MAPDTPGPATLATGLLVIGRKEYLDFPPWGLRRVRVKVDTGARTSALDVAGYEIERDGSQWQARVRLVLHPHRHRRVVEVLAPVVRMARVRSTAGECEERPVIEAEVRLGPVHKRIRLTLANRSAMRHRMILGREALAGSFLVDVSRAYLLRDRKG
jgi:hypothetical protein